MTRVERIGSATLYLADCLDVLPDIGNADCAITDPPYNVGKAYNSHPDDMRAADYCAWLGARFCRLRCGTLLYTPGDRHLWDAPTICQVGGFTLNRPLGWHKKEFAGDKWTGGPAISWEPIVWASRGPKQFNKIFGISGRDFLVVNATHGDPWAKLHPCPKPLPVMRWLVGLFCPPGGTVVDPFMGTGTTGAACAFQGRSFVGIEIDKAYFEAALRRIEDAQRQRDMFHDYGPEPTQATFPDPA